jgi:hypothetical protein
MSDQQLALLVMSVQSYDFVAKRTAHGAHANACELKCRFVAANAGDSNFQNWTTLLHVRATRKRVSQDILLAWFVLDAEVVLREE